MGNPCVHLFHIRILEDPLPLDAVTCRYRLIRRGKLQSTCGFQGVLICIAGLGLQVLSDHYTDKNYPALDKSLGDGLMIAGATLYGFSMSGDTAYICLRLISLRRQCYGRVACQEETSLRSMGCPLVI